MSLEVAKYMATKWLEAELELSGYLLQMDIHDCKIFTTWLISERKKYVKMRDEIAIEALLKEK